MEFICLNPGGAKRKKIAVSLQPIGRVFWWPFVLLSLRGYPESEKRAQEALKAAARYSSNRCINALKFSLYKLQYNYARRVFEKRKNAVAVCWNGLNGTRRAFMSAAKDAGLKTLFFELSPFKDRITVDPDGVNYLNSLPRDPDAYLKWAESYGVLSLSGYTNKIKQRPNLKGVTSRRANTPSNQSFIFFPLQVPGDSQLRLFGGDYRSLDSIIDALPGIAQVLPDGWYLRLKEHPSSKLSYAGRINGLRNPRIVLDNDTDTFSQVAASKAVMTVNSSVGLEAMFFDKPVLALGRCFWAIPGVAVDCSLTATLDDCLSNPENLCFSQEKRAAFLSYLLDEYYPDLSDSDSEGRLSSKQTQKILRRLKAPATADHSRWIQNAAR